MTANPEKIRPVRVLAFVEASWVSGPAKNLIALAQRAARVQDSASNVNLAFATFQRDLSPARNEFLLACRQAGVATYVIQERFAFDLKILAGVRDVIAAHNPDILQTHSVKSHFLLKLTGMYRRYRWIAFHHGYTWVNLKVRLYNQLDRLSLRSASRVVTVCSAFRADLEKCGVAPDRIIIRHNSVKPFLPPVEDRVRELRRSLGILPGTKVILSIGRLSREKGQSDLVKAFSFVYRNHSDAKLLLILVGTGPEYQSLKNMAENLNLADSVLFPGHQADVSPFYTIADVVVLPSHTEGSPNVLLEAMAAGLPIVSTAVGGVPEIVTSEKEALLVEKNDPISLARAIERLVGDEALRKRISSAARTTVSAYSPEEYFESIFSLYRNCMLEDVRHLAPR